ncbi:rhodanese-like domain-containing protein [Lutibacter sp.]|uniref:rhodanese-like domain-containing protein n=1 Tax=Lutibacter sp. TaxID=1925666 RepID=UPI001A258377|nr:rhodanese-like domain-containing protein [Lutibacter sp.]MBI9042038.1 rhodanese-like domain-containing protein [Lutibacter sp.]
MKKISLILIGLFLIPTLFLTSCDKGDDTLIESTPAQTLMADYMLSANLDLPNVDTSVDGAKFVAAPPATEADLPAFLAKYYIIDIRSAADYATSHIAGAKNVVFANILAEGTAAGAKPVLVVCYTGQTACYATALMRMYGFKNTQALKWGMSGWNSTTAGSWNNNIGNIAEGNSNWSYDAAPANQVFSKPAFTSLSTTGEAILKKRVEEVVAAGFKTVKGSDVLAAPSNYFVNNFFGSADYTGFGHIKGAYRIQPLSIADNSVLALDPNAKVVTYCYTGQTSAVVTAWLRVLGYDAYSLSFGMNGMYNSNTAWTSNKWSTGVSKNLPFGN